MRLVKFKVVSLFSGAGGLDLGFIQTQKYEICLANDISPHAVETYALNFKVNKIENPKNIRKDDLPAVVQGDVSELDLEILEGEEIDVVIGGPPCQDFSIVRGPPNERRGIKVKRGRLYAYFVKALVLLQPKIFVFENVPGLVSANKKSAYKVILEDFSNLNLRWDDVKKQAGILNSKSQRSIQGYEIVYNSILDFSKLGVPQARKRLIVVGVRKDLVDDFIMLNSIGAELKRLLNCGGAPKLLCKYPLTPIEVFEGKPLPELEDKYVEIMKEWEGVWTEVGTKKAYEWKKEVWDNLSFDVVEDYLRINKINSFAREEIERAFKVHKMLLKELGYYGVRVADLDLPDGSNEVPNESISVIERMKMIPPDENHEFVRGTKWEVEGRGMSLIYRRIHPLKPAYTVVAYGGGGTHGYHYERNRATLTNREKARLQTFPDSFLFAGTKSEVRAQIGEAVPPLASKRIAEALSKILKLL